MSVPPGRPKELTSPAGGTERSESGGRVGSVPPGRRQELTSPPGGTGRSETGAPPLPAAANTGCVDTRDRGCYAAIIQAPFGALGLRTRGDHLSGIDFLPPDHPLKAPDTGLALRAARRLAAYFSDPATVFDLPIEPAGTPFRQAVWQTIRSIGCGQTRTYGELAAILHSAPRAVGQALGDNPLPIVVPCHRVVGKRGLGGFAHASSGYSLDIKRWLLRHEGVLR